MFFIKTVIIFRILQSDSPWLLVTTFDIHTYSMCKFHAVLHRVRYTPTAPGSKARAWVKTQSFTINVLSMSVWGSSGYSGFLTTLKTMPEGGIVCVCGGLVFQVFQSVFTPGAEHFWDKLQIPLHPPRSLTKIRSLRLGGKYEEQTLTQTQSHSNCFHEAKHLSSLRTLTHTERRWHENPFIKNSWGF